MIGNSDMVNLWDDKWLPRTPLFKIITPRIHGLENLKVSMLINKEVGEWDESLIRINFLPVDANEILKIPLCISRPLDIFVWHFKKNGM